MSSPTAKARPNPEFIFETLNAYQQTAALRAAIALDIFTKIGEGTDTFPALAKRCEATERGIRILCDYLVVHGFLTSTTIVTRSPTIRPHSSTGARPRASPPQQASSLARYDQRLPRSGPHDSHWAAGNGGRQGIDLGGKSHLGRVCAFDGADGDPVSGRNSRHLDAPAGKKWKVLDLAGGHGMFGITLAKRNPNAEIFAQDWGPVLAVATENARAAGVAARHHVIPGSAFEVEYGTGYDIVLITNFLHHFDAATNEKFLCKVRASLAPSGIVATLDFIPNEDRVSPPALGRFQHDDAWNDSSGRRLHLQRVRANVPKRGILVERAAAAADGRPQPDSLPGLIRWRAD